MFLPVSVAVPGCKDLSEGADITVPPSVSFQLSHCCSEARQRRMRRARTQGHLLQLRPSSFSLPLTSPLPLRWSICHCRGSHGSLDQSNYCWEQLWRDGGRGSMETENVEGKKRAGRKILKLNPKTLRRRRTEFLDMKERKRQTKAWGLGIKRLKRNYLKLTLKNQV